MKRNSGLLSGSDAVLEHRSSTRDLPEIGTKLYEPSSSWLEGNRLRNALQERHALISQPKIERDCVLCVGKWEAEDKRVVVLKKRGKELETFGHHDSQCSSTYILNPEEALFLVESNSMVLLNENVEVSVEMCYALLLEGGEEGCSLQQYRVFSHLSRLGYKLIRHKKPMFRGSKSKVPPASSSIKELTSVATSSKTQRKECVELSRENVVVIDDSSSENDDDIVIVDVIKRSCNKDIIQIEDDDSHDSDIVILENESLVELPLEDWSYVHRSKFLSGNQTENSVIRVDPLIVAQSDSEILNEIPNVKGYKSWLFRADENLLPHGVWPFHYKYLIDLNEQKSWNNRGRGGFRGYRGFRGRGYYLQRQVSQMKNYTLSLLNMVSQFMGGQCLQVIPPPPSLFHGPNYRDPRGNRGRVSWGRISFGSRGVGYRGNDNVPISEMIELSDDDEQMEDIKPIVKTESSDEEDVKPKRLKLEVDVEPADNGNTSVIKTEPVSIKKECNIKSESNFVIDVKPNLSLSTDKTLVKTENQVKMETDENEPIETEVSSIREDTINDKVISEGEAIPSDSSTFATSDISCNLVDSTSLSLVNGITSKDDSNNSNLNKETTQIHKDTSLSSLEKNETRVSDNVEIASNKISDDIEDASNKVTDNIEIARHKVSDNIKISSSKVSDNIEMIRDDVSQETTTKTNCNDTSEEEREKEEVENLPSNPESSSSSLNVVNFDRTSDNLTVDKCEKAEGSLTLSNAAKNNENIDKLPINSEENNVTNASSQNSNANHLESTTVEQMETIDCDLNLEESSLSCQRQEKNEKKKCWKELKECDPLCSTVEEENSKKESVEEIEDDSPSDDYSSSLIQPHHCTSLDEVLKRLSIIKEFKSKVPLETEKDLVVTVKYDVYLPTSTYYRNLPPSPDLRLIILRPEDPLPDANQMSLLKQIYNDNKSFLFAVVLPESIAYYLYDTVHLPVDNETL